MIYQAMILAAGRGERMRPSTDRVPKPLQVVRGKPLLAWHLEALARARFDEVVINGAWLSDQIRDFIGADDRWGLPVRWSPESRALGTAGGIAQALSWLTAPAFAVISADLFTDYDYARLLPIIDFLSKPGNTTQGHLVLVENPDYPRDFSLDQGMRVRLPGERAGTYGNIGVFRRDFFSTLEQGVVAELGPLLRQAVKSDGLSGEWCPRPWINVGTVEDLERANREGC